MAKEVAKGLYQFPFYYQRILASCQGWKDDQFGAYIKLLIYQFDKGSIPNDMDTISLIAPSAKKHWKLLSTKFKVMPDGTLQNAVMDDVREDVLNKQFINSVNGKKGGRPKSERLANGYKNDNPNETVRLANGCDSLNRSGNPNDNPNHNPNESQPIWLLDNGSKGGSTEGGKWVHNPTKHFDITQEEGHQAKEFIARVKQVYLSAERIKDFWIAFQTNEFTGENFYSSRARCLKHFRDWLKFQDLEKQKTVGNPQQLTSAPLKKLIS